GGGAARGVGGGRAAAWAARASADSWGKLQVVFGRQMRRRRRRARIETIEPAMSTSEGPNMLLTTNWVMPKDRPAVRQAGHTSRIAFLPAMAQTSQKGTRTEKNGSCRPAMAESAPPGRPGALARVMIGVPRAP